MPKPKKAFSPLTAQSAESRRQNPAYPNPDVPAAFGDFLSPRQVTAAGLEVVVSYPTIKPGDVIALKFNGDDTFVPIKVEGQTSVSFWVSVGHIIKALGTTVDIQYTLGGESAGQRSDVLQLTVLPFMEGDLEMAKILDASPPTPGVLDLATFTGDTIVEIAPWPLISAGQTVWLNLEYDGQARPIYVIAGEKVTATEVGSGITRPLFREELQDIPHGTLIQIPLAVNFSGDDIRSQAVSFDTLKLEVRQEGQGGTELIEDFTLVSPGKKVSPFSASYLTFETIGSSMDVIQDENNEIGLRISSIELPRLATIYLPLNCDNIRIPILAKEGVAIICHYESGEPETKTITSSAYEEVLFLRSTIQKITMTDLGIWSSFSLGNIHLTVQPQKRRE